MVGAINKSLFSSPSFAGGILLISFVFLLSGPYPKSTAASSPIVGKKVGGIQGSPAYKRGFVLGFDAGYKAAKKDWAKNKISKPSSHDRYKNAEKFFRFEYGKKTKFVRGFRRGFVKGYQWELKRLKDHPPTHPTSLQKGIR